MSGAAGEQVQREHPHKVLLQGQVPQGMGEHCQSVPWHLGRGHTRLW